MKKHVLFILFLVFFIGSCDNGSKKESIFDGDLLTDSDEDATTDEIVDELVDETIDEIIDEVTDEISDDDIGVVDPCAPNPCTEANKTVCQNDGAGGYTCLCDLYTCEIAELCIVDRAVNTLNQCEECDIRKSSNTWSVRDDGSDCEFDFGIDGSGMCREGICGEFGACDNRAYDQAAGYPCNFDSECGTGRCLPEAGLIGMSMVWNRVCSSACDKDDDCPGEMFCHFTSNEIGRECRRPYPSYLITLPQKQALYKPCNTDTDCEGDYCLAYGTDRFCSKECAGSLIDLDCGSCGKCNEGGEDYKFDNICVPKGSGLLGNPCETSMDCNSGGCQELYCTKSCGGILQSCGDGFECKADIFQTGIETCIDSDRLDMPLGTPCNEDYQCVSGWCAEFEQGKFCSALCNDDPCPSGTCLELGTTTLKATLTIYESDTTTVLTTYTGTNPSRSQSVTESGTYYVKVEGSTATDAGHYYFMYGTGAVLIPESLANDVPADATLLKDGDVIDAILVAETPDWYKVEVDLGTASSKSIRFQVSKSPRMACGPDWLQGSNILGQRCTYDWQCPSGLACDSELATCTKSCVEDSDCENGLCHNFLEDDPDTEEEEALYRCISEKDFETLPDGYLPYWFYECENITYPDNTLQQYYCSSECTSDDECAPLMGCLDKMCRYPYPGRTPEYNSCRFDGDCMKTMDCLDKTCTVNCATESECPGYPQIAPPPVGEKGLCAPCEVDQDCQVYFFTPESCMTGADGTKFCTSDCSDDPGVCPEGSRCYGAASGAVCIPLGRQCATGGPTCSDDRNYCITPTLPDGFACPEDGACWSGICKNGFCQSGTCTADADCGCDSMVCEGGACNSDESKYVREVEPNNTIATAQVISTPGEIAAFQNHAGAILDVDYFSVDIKAGQTLNVRTLPLCESRGDTYLRLVTADGTLIGENDDSSGSTFFSQLSGYTPTVDQTVYIEVTQSPLTPDPYPVGYILEVNYFTPTENSSCATAKPLTVGTYNESLKQATNDYATATCSDGYGYGPDLFYTITVPAGDTLTVRATGEPEDFYPEISIISTCEAGATCYAGSSFTHPGMEEVSYFNSGDAKDVIIVIDTPQLPVNYDFVLHVDIESGTVPTNDIIATATELTGSGTITEATTMAENDYTPTGEECGTLTNEGIDVVYEINLGVNDFMHIEFKNYFSGLNMYFVKATDLDNCFMAMNLIFNYSPETEAEKIYLIIDGNAAEDYGNFSFDYIIGTTDYGTCFGICEDKDADSVDDGRGCVPDNDLCICDDTTGLIKTIDCDDSCDGYSEYLADSGTCVAGPDFTAGCYCHISDCSAEEAQVDAFCSEGIFTSCTCSSADPCGWGVSDGTCNLCTLLDPANSFTDPDCE